MLAFYADSSACKNIPVRPETNFVRPGATRDFILGGTAVAGWGFRQSGDALSAILGRIKTCLS